MTARSERFGPTWPLLGATILGAASNNVVSVPLQTIATDFAVSFDTATYALTAFIVAMAGAMPLLGWVGSRVGPARMLLGAMLIVGLGHLLAAASISVSMLVVIRAVQGLSCAAVPSMVMLLLRGGDDAPIAAMSRWAGANAAGQALGPAVGGGLSAIFGWRGMLCCLGVVSLSCAVALLVTQRDARRPATRHLDLASPLLLTTCCYLIFASLQLMPRLTSPALPGAMLALGVAIFGLFWRRAGSHPATAVVSIETIRVASYRLALVGATSQMYFLGTITVLIPLWAMSEWRLGLAAAGAALASVPASMWLLAPVSRRVGLRLGSTKAMWCGMLLLSLAAFTCMVVSIAGPTTTGAVAAIILVGVSSASMSLIQTVSATLSASRTADGASLGLFNSARFGASSAGAITSASLAHSQLGEPVHLSVFAVVVLLASAAGLKWVVARP